MTQGPMSARAAQGCGRTASHRPAERGVRWSSADAIFGVALRTRGERTGGEGGASTFVAADRLRSSSPSTPGPAAYLCAHGVRALRRPSATPVKPAASPRALASDRARVRRAVARPCAGGRHVAFAHEDVRAVEVVARADRPRLRRAVPPGRRVQTEARRESVMRLLGVGCRRDTLSARTRRLTRSSSIYVAELVGIRSASAKEAEGLAALVHPPLRLCSSRTASGSQVREASKAAFPANCAIPG
jgi:hypothetical protein